MDKSLGGLTSNALDRLIQQSEQEAQIANQVGMHLLDGFRTWPADEVRQAYDLTLEGETGVVRNGTISQGAFWLSRLVTADQLKEIAVKRGIELR